MDKLSFLKGLALGLAGKPLEFAKGEPIEPVDYYLYGRIAEEDETPTHTIDGVGYMGAVLPDIYTVYTEELQAQYPYAFIVYEYEPVTSTIASLYLSPDQCRYNPIVSGVEIPNHNGLAYLYKGGGWEFNDSTDGSVAQGVFREIFDEYLVWCNKDITKYSGTDIYLAASDCVTVYEQRS